MQKNKLRQIKTDEITIALPDLKNAEQSKAVAISKWIMEWIDTDLANGKIKFQNLLPSKADFAFMLGVSIGTIQNALRFVEDAGYVESKQCIGTMLKDYRKPANVRKLTSKRDIAIIEIKRYILNGGFKVGSYLPSSRTIATIIGYSNNTTRLAIDALVAENILKRRFKNSKDNGWIVLSLDFDCPSGVNSQNSQTLVDMAAKDLEKIITSELKLGDKIPSHHQLAQRLKVSLKTVHDALQILVQKGYLLPRRGTYGTTVIKFPGSSNSSKRLEDKIFAPAKVAALYHYEKTQNHIKKLIAQNYEIGDKLPSIVNLAKDLGLSPNTVRTALQNLSKEGYLVFSRGRYGGTFVIDIPELEPQAFKWLSVNPSFAKEYQNLKEN